MEKLRIGTAGIPISTPKKDTKSGVRRVRELNLDCMELEFVHGVRLSEDKALLIKEEALKNDVRLSVHAPYYINLNSLEDEKTEKSIERIIKSAHIGKLCGADRVTFHPAFYMKKEPGFVVNRVIEGLLKVLENIPEGIKINPETTGRLSSFGSIDELLLISKALPQVGMCIDFGHIYTRSLGKLNSYKDFAEILEKTGNAINGFLSDVHFHVSNILFGNKGEIKHLPLNETYKSGSFNWKDFIRSLKDFDVKGLLICESPAMEDDAKILSDYYRSL
jgi:deoxyribonuclease-4